MQLKCYVDAAFNCYSDAKSHYGYAYFLGDYNGSFYAKSAKMKIVALSYPSTDAEYCRRLLDSIGFTQKCPTVIYVDNMSCVKMSYSDLSHNTTKHINPKYHFTKDNVKDGEISVEHISTNYIIADVLTKPLSVR